MGFESDQFPTMAHHHQFGSLPKRRSIDTVIFLPRLSLAAKFGFPETENRGCGDVVGMRMRASVRRLAKSVVVINMLAVAAAARRNADQYAVDSLCKAISSCLDGISRSECAVYLANSGYGQRIREML